MPTPTMIPPKQEPTARAQTRDRQGGHDFDQGAPPSAVWDVAGRSLRWMGGASGGVLFLGVAGACCGGLSLGVVAAATGAAGLAAGLGSVLLALASALGLALASLARRRTTRRDDPCCGARAGAHEPILPAGERERPTDPGAGPRRGL